MSSTSPAPGAATTAPPLAPVALPMASAAPVHTLVPPQVELSPAMELDDLAPSAEPEVPVTSGDMSSRVAPASPAPAPTGDTSAVALATPAPAPPVVGPSTSAEEAGALFIDSLLLPLQEDLVPMAPLWRAARPVPASLIPHRSDRLAAKAVFHDPNPEKQAKHVLVNKWEHRPDDAVTDIPDGTVAVKFHETFAEPLSLDTREAMRELLYPLRGTRRSAVAAQLFQ